MLFTELRFFFFFAFVFGLYWTLPSNRYRKVLLLLASYAFYAAWNWKFLSLILVSTLVDYSIGLKLGSSTPGPEHLRVGRRAWISLSVAWNLGVLFFFKYFNFGIQSAQVLLCELGLHPNLHMLDIILPVGISFFTFQSMSYSIDVYHGKLAPCKSLLDFSTFIAFFPQLFSGPIVRAIDFLPQLETARRFDDVQVRALLVMFLIGFIKKTCVADNLAPFADDYFANPSAFDALGCWTAVLFYAAQIYSDFSGYTDMAIATAGLLGFRFCQNFDFPYFSGNIAQFWRRWHMSLSSWLRDYLYIALGGNRGGKIRQYRNLLLTMLLGGLWHGAAWTFVAWGAIHGMALIVHREFSRARAVLGWRLGGGVTGARVASAAGVATTFMLVASAWIFFRAANFSIALTALRSFLLLHSPGTENFGMGGLLAFVMLAVIHWVAYRGFLRAWWRDLPAWQFAVACAALLASALPWAPLGYKPFIYFQF